jgi:hypothetical protein
VYGDGRKEQPLITYHATEGPAEGIPKASTVARELHDGIDKKGEQDPTDVLLGCNPNAYFYVQGCNPNAYFYVVSGPEHSLHDGTIMEGMSKRPAVLIETADAYRCHG